MNKTILSITALNAAILAGTIYQRTSGIPTAQEAQVSLATDAQTVAIYDALDPAPKAEIDKAPSKQCTKDGTTILGNDHEPTTGLWQCGGAIMPAWVQTALDKAAAKVPTGTMGAERIGP